MKVLIISTVSLAKNGIATCILNYYHAIDNSEIQMDIVAPNIVDKELKNDLKSNGSKVYELTMRKTSTVKYFLKLINIIRENKYDIIHAHGNSCTLAIEMIAALLGGCKVRIAHSHNTSCEYMKVHKLLRPLFNLTCTHGFACGEDAGRWLFRNKKFTVIKNGIDMAKYQYDEKIRNEYREKLNVKDEILIGHIGLFNYQKNHEFLIQVLLELQKNSLKKFKLMLIGDGELKASIEKLVQKFHLSEYVIFTGNVDNVTDYLQAIDMFLLPSRYEGLPYVLVEAQAAGLPCIVSDNVAREANLTDMLEFMSLSDSKIWAQRIGTFAFKNRLEKNIKVQTQISAAGYNISTNADKIKGLYRKYLKK